ncbi:MAG TPA: glucan biosynthesis protein G [Devosia sp.]|nr:glucan biosynthesis protein G [Devosia sp.]
MTQSPPVPHLSRRLVLQGLGATLALLSTTTLTGPGFAAQSAPQSFAFSFDALTARMRETAAAPYVPPSFKLPELFAGLDYDAYRKIQYRSDHGKWAELDAGYQVHGFHLGWLFPEPVKLYELVDGTAAPLVFSAADFEYHDTALGLEAAKVEFPGVAGFRLNYPLNAPDRIDELVSFLGASYFRALGRDNVYGQSARGLLLNSWIEGPEEFPRFSEFYLERPSKDAPLVLYAALDSQSVTGAYRFEITPANDGEQASIMDVTARLFFRSDVTQLGVAPLTSMFLYADANRAGFDDYRPQVHDTNGLSITRETGEKLWRALDNVPARGDSYFWENNPRAFGLDQRGRDFATYQDAGAHYERRPSVRVEPSGDWGQGNVRLIEVPSTLEVDDNIVAFWVPAEPVLAGQEREYRYRLLWGDLVPDTTELAYVVETRAGAGGVSGVANAANLRKFVIDFSGGALTDWEPETPPDVLANVSSGTIKTSTVSKVAANGVWRLVLDVEAGSEPAPIELKAYLVGGGKQLTETWLYQWRAQP